MITRRRPGEIRDAVIEFLADRPAATVAQIERAVSRSMDGEVAASSVRSYLRLNTPDLFERVGRGEYRLRDAASYRSEGQKPLFEGGGVKPPPPCFAFGDCVVYQCDCFDWFACQKDCSIHAVVTDPPFGLVEYSDTQQRKLRDRKGGVWRIPPSFDGARRSPLPRFTTLTAGDIDAIYAFFRQWSKRLLPVLVPGANVLVASNPLVSHVVANAMADAGLERRGELIRLVMTMRGGDRPKNAHDEFSEVSVMPRSMWEPWLMFRRPIEGRVQDNLRKWSAGGFRRPSGSQPFGDVIRSAPTRKAERQLANHPSLKPQAFLRQVVRAALPLGRGIVLDPFAGSGSTLAAAEAVGYASVGIERDPQYVDVAKKAIPRLAAYSVRR